VRGGECRGLPAAPGTVAAYLAHLTDAGLKASPGAGRAPRRWARRRRAPRRSRLSLRTNTLIGRGDRAVLLIGFPAARSGDVVRCDVASPLFVSIGKGGRIRRELLRS
jgi:hypothetical protein